MRIERVEAVPVRLGFRGTFATSRGVVGAADAGAEHVVVKVTAADGTVGWGEVRPSRRWSDETQETVWSTINRYFAPALVGRDVFDAVGHDQALSAEIAPHFTLGQPLARAGVELAVWDLVGQLVGQPVQRLLGGTAQRAITLSWTVLGHDAEAVAVSVADGQRRGYHHFNFKIGFGRATDLVIARTIADLAPDAFLWADANGALTVDTAVQASRDLAAVGVAVLEQPLPLNQYLDYPVLRQRSALPLGVDEGVLAPTDLLQLIRLGALDVFVVKIGRMGGLRRARQAIELAQAAGLKVLASGLTESDLMLAAYAHLLAACGVTAPCALNGRQFLAEQLADGLGGAGDQVVVPSGPGWGVTVDEARMDRLRVSLTGALEPTDEGAT